MTKISKYLLVQGHLIWAVSIINIGIGFFIPGFDVLSKSISHVALEAPVFAYIHRIADIVIGLSMLCFAIGVGLSSPSKFSIASLTSALLGISMISAGIWTLESPLHLLYNLSIFMILIPVCFALEFKNILKSRHFESFCVLLALLHVFMFWIIYAGFIPGSLNGLIQRLWAIPTMGWFGISVYYLLKSSRQSNI
jgi:hypothetical protein